MRILPRTPLDVAEFSAARTPVWAAAPAAIGLDASEVARVSAATERYRDALAAAERARAASLAATEALRQAAEEMRDRVSNAVQKIRLFARASGDREVYGRAMVPSPSPAAGPGTAPPPAQPKQLNATFAVTGAPSITFRAPGSGPGTVFMVRRKLAGSDGFVPIGTAGSTRGLTKRFTDTTLPAGTSTVQYIIHGQRGGLCGPDSHVLTVLVGSQAAAAHAREQTRAA